MKNIKHISILILLFCSSQIGVSQSTLDNGRPLGTVPEVSKKNQNSTSDYQVTKNGDVDDQDVPGAPGEKPNDYFYPMDMDLLNENLGSDISSAELILRINELANMIESLRLENNLIRRNLMHCCSGTELGLTARDAYLIQNAPNPFNVSADILYFVPEGLSNVEIHICDIKGEKIRNYSIDDQGFGRISVEAGNLPNGSYLYMLSVEEEIVDSKVMIITN